MSQSQVKASKGHFIQGQWIQGSGTLLESINPAYGSLLWQGHEATEAEIIEASRAARQALPNWSLTPFDQRAAILIQFAKKVEQQKEQLALLISQETGKPLWESYTEVTAVINKISISIKAYQERTQDRESQTPEANSCLRFKPQGVVVVLGAFNFPAHLSNGHIVPALLAGNTVLYKPSELTPAVAECIMQCWQDSGIPPGVVNCLQGGASCGGHLLAQDIQGVFFTGSYQTGLAIHKHFAQRPEVILALEMGGNNPLIVDEIKNLRAGLYHSLLSTLITAGQRCTCARRVLIPDSHSGDQFLQGFIKACSTIKTGPFDKGPEPFMGPVISASQAEKLLQAQQSLIQLGGSSLLPLRLLAQNTGLLSPGIIDMTKASSHPDEEFFGPLVQIYRYKTFDEALDLANKSRYGLAAGLLSDNEKRYQAFYHSIRAGLINWNRPTTGAASTLPFGGVGLSGNHRPSAYFAADYCAYPVASMEQAQLILPESLLPGLSLE